MRTKVIFFLHLMIFVQLFSSTQSSPIVPNLAIEIYVEVDNITGNPSDDVFIVHYPNGTVANNTFEIFRLVDYHFLFTSLNGTHLLAFSGLNQDPGGFSAMEGVNSTVDITVTDETFFVLECGIHDQTVVFITPTDGNFITVTSYSYTTEYTTLSSGSFNVTETLVISSVLNHTSETTVTSTENVLSETTIVITETAPLSFTLIWISLCLMVMMATKSRLENKLGGNKFE